jgi:hypothetical protein
MQFKKKYDFKIKQHNYSCRDKIVTSLKRAEDEN